MLLKTNASLRCRVPFTPADRSASRPPAGSDFLYPAPVTILIKRSLPDITSAVARVLETKHCNTTATNLAFLEFGPSPHW